ncbi:MAG TPA: PilZ domain-containing protein, partial [Kofleriaceae bacterium]|nr:PilZ domain-containing protein [Kofleriaceae bacterium]
MSRRAPRYRISLNVTVCPLLGGKMAVCHTRDVSDVGICLDTSEVSEWLPVGTRVSLALTDPRSGTAMEVVGDVVREVGGASPALGVLLIDPPGEWNALVANAARQSGTIEKPGKRM